jgi:hypothetical protein
MCAGSPRLPSSPCRRGARAARRAVSGARNGRLQPHRAPQHRRLGQVDRLATRSSVARRLSNEMTDKPDVRLRTTFPRPHRGTSERQSPLSGGGHQTRLRILQHDGGTRSHPIPAQLSFHRCGRWLCVPRQRRDHFVGCAAGDQADIASTRPRRASPTVDGADLPPQMLGPSAQGRKKRIIGVFDVDDLCPSRVNESAGAIGNSAAARCPPGRESTSRTPRDRSAQRVVPFS